MFDKLKELMQLKSAMEEVKRQLEKETVTAESPKSEVVVVINGAQEIKEIRLSAGFASLEKAKMEKILAETVNKAVRDSHKLAAQKLGAVTGFQLPGA